MRGSSVRVCVYRCMCVGGYVRGVCVCVFLFVCVLSMYRDDELKLKTWFCGQVAADSVQLA